MAMEGRRLQPLPFPVHLDLRLSKISQIDFGRFEGRPEGFARHGKVTQILDDGDFVLHR